MARWGTKSLIVARKCGLSNSSDPKGDWATCVSETGSDRDRSATGKQFQLATEHGAARQGEPDVKKQFRGFPPIDFYRPRTQLIELHANPFGSPSFELNRQFYPFLSFFTRFSVREVFLNIIIKAIMTQYHNYNITTTITIWNTCYENGRNRRILSSCSFLDKYRILLCTQNRIVSVLTACVIVEYQLNNWIYFLPHLPLLKFIILSKTKTIFEIKIFERVLPIGSIKRCTKTTLYSY